MNGAVREPQLTAKGELVVVVDTVGALLLVEFLPLLGSPNPASSRRARLRRPPFDLRRNYCRIPEENWSGRSYASESSLACHNHDRHDRTCVP